MNDKIILSAFSDEYADDFTEQLEGMNRFGIGCIELRFVDKKNISVLNDEELLIVRKKLSDHGVKVSSVGSPIGKIPLDGDFAAHTDMAKRIFETACFLGTKRVRMFSFYPPKEKNIADCKEEVFLQIEKLIDLADTYGITLCHENEGDLYGESPERCLELAKRFHGRLKIVFDMGNYVCGGYEPYPYGYTLLKDHIGYFHIKDATRAHKIVLPGTGDAKIKEILGDFTRSSAEPVLISIEPHLTTFSGMQELNAKTAGAVENAFSDQKTAFAASVASVKDIIDRL